MNRDTAATRVADGLGFRTDLMEKIVLRMQEAQRNLEQGKTLPWFLIEEDAQLTLPTESHEVPIEEGFIREAPEWTGPMRVIGDSTTRGRRVPKRTFTDAWDAYSTREDGAPAVYVLRKENYYFFPRSNKEYTLLHSYYKAGDLLVTNLNSWLNYCPEVIIGDAGVRMATDLRDDQAVTLFSNMRAAAWQAVFNETIMREEEARKQAVGRGR